MADIILQKVTVKCKIDDGVIYFNGPPQSGLVDGITRSETTDIINGLPRTNIDTFNRLETTDIINGPPRSNIDMLNRSELISIVNI